MRVCTYMYVCITCVYVCNCKCATHVCERVHLTREWFARIRFSNKEIGDKFHTLSLDILLTYDIYSYENIRFFTALFFFFISVHSSYKHVFPLRYSSSFSFFLPLFSPFFLNLTDTVFHIFVILKFRCIYFYKIREMFLITDRKL